MDLGTVRVSSLRMKHILFIDVWPCGVDALQSNLAKGVYTNHLQCAEDIRLIWKNCMRYNVEGSALFVLARRLQAIFEERYNKPKSTGVLEDIEPERCVLIWSIPACYFEMSLQRTHC